MVCESLEHLIHLGALVCTCDAETVLGSVINTGCMHTLSLGARMWLMLAQCAAFHQDTSSAHEKKELSQQIRILCPGFPIQFSSWGVPVRYCTVSTQIWSAFRISALSGVKMLYLRLVLVSIICVITCLHSSILWIHNLIVGCQKGHEISICEDCMKNQIPVVFPSADKIQMKMNKPWSCDKNVFIFMESGKV